MSIAILIVLLLIADACVLYAIASYFDRKQQREEYEEAMRIKKEAGRGMARLK